MAFQRIVAMMLVSLAPGFASATAFAADAATRPAEPLEAPVYRPLPISTGGEKPSVLSLGGTWSFRVNPPDAFFAMPADPMDKTAAVEVPGEWVMQGLTVPDGGEAGYRRDFTIPAGWNGARVILRADAIFSECRIWINGRAAGSHLGGFTPIELDVTDLVRPGENRIAVGVRSDSLADKLASASKYAVHPLGGITRKIRLFAVPPIHAAAMNVTTDLDASYKDATVHVAAAVRNDSPAEAKLTCTVDILGPWLLGKPLRRDANEPLATGRKTLDAKPGRTVDAEFSIDLPGAALWHTEHPNLYRARLTIAAGGKVLEVVERRFGCREIEVRGNELLVNGKVQKLFGVCRHEVHPRRGRSLTGDLWRRDVELYRAGNVNLIRTSHYPPAEELFDAADELGMFVECEAPFCWASAKHGTAQAVRDATVRQTLEMGQFYRNHPCVVLWSLGNESGWTEHFEASSVALRKLDPTRPQTAEHFRGSPPSKKRHREIFSTHYPGPGGPDKYRDADRPTNFGEYCHLNAYNRFELATDPGLRDAWGGPTSRMVNAMRKSRGVVGGSIWSAMDDTFFIPPPRDDANAAMRVVGYGTWGPLDGWRRPKPEYWHLKKAYSPVRVEGWDLSTHGRGSTMTVRVANRYVFTNLSAVRIEWQSGTRGGTARADVAPGKVGTFRIALPTTDPNANVRLRFTGPLGFVVDESVVGRSAPAVAKADTDAPSPAKVTADAKAVTIPAGTDASVNVTRATGLITGATMSGRKLAIAGPHLMLLPLSGAGETQMKGKAPAYPIFSSPCANWRPAGPAKLDGNALTVAGRYDEATGTFTYRPAPGGGLEIAYAFTCARDVNPRQVGIVLDLPRSFQTLAWRRKGQWSCYPADHIGRLRGSAEAFPKGVPLCTQAGPADQPTWPWKDDATPNGSNDFRSTKANIFSASLRASDGPGAVEVVSDGSRHVRAWIDDSGAHLLIADYSNAGAERFFARHAHLGYQPLKKGDKVEGKVRIRLVKSDANEEKPAMKYDVSFKYENAAGIGREKNVIRRDPSDVIEIGGKQYVWYTKVTRERPDGRKDPLYPSGYAGRVWYAVSTDRGHTWKEMGQAVGVGTGDDFDATGVFTPNILAFDGRYYLYYTAVGKGFVNKGYADVGRTAIGLATADSPDGPWTKVKHNPVLRTTKDPSKFDSFRVDDACLIVRDGKVWLYYKGRQWQHTPGETQMGLAVADTPLGPYTRANGGNPVQDSGHEVMVWPFGKGVMSMVSNTGPHGLTLQYAEDGVHFNVVGKLPHAHPAAPGAFRPDMTDPAAMGKPITWGISMDRYPGGVALKRYEITVQPAGD